MGRVRVRGTASKNWTSYPKIGLPRCGSPVHPWRGLEGGACALPIDHHSPHSSPEAYARRKKQAKERQVRRVYGLLPKEYEALREVQGGKCALCRRATGKTKRLAVDHRHDHHKSSEEACRECVRGLLCGPCNTHLGWVEWVGLEQLYSYVMSPPAHSVLEPTVT